MALTQEQTQRLRQMSPEQRRAFHTNRIATSLEAIEALLRSISIKLGAPDDEIAKSEAEGPGSPSVGNH